jgi:hypothetical protein
MVIARQQLGKYTPVATDTHATMEELLDAVFSIRYQKACLILIYPTHNTNKNYTTFNISAYLVKNAVEIHMHCFTTNCIK